MTHKASSDIHIYLHVMSSEGGADAHCQPISQPDSIKEKIVRVFAYTLISLGTFFLLAGAGTHAARLFIGGSFARRVGGETIYPMGVFSIIAGLNLLQDPKRDSLKTTLRLGVLSVSV